MVRVKRELCDAVAVRAARRRGFGRDCDFLSAVFSVLALYLREPRCRYYDLWHSTTHLLSPADVVCSCGAGIFSSLVPVHWNLKALLFGSLLDPPPDLRSC